MSGGHGGHVDPHNKEIALLISILALVLAFSETLGKSAQTEAMSYNIQASKSVGVLPGEDHPPDDPADRRRAA